MESVMIPGETFPGRKRRDRARMFVKVDQPLVEQPVDARGGGVGSKAGIEVDRRARKPEADNVIGRPGARRKHQDQRQTDSQQSVIYEYPFFTAETQRTQRFFVYGYQSAGY